MIIKAMIAVKNRENEKKIRDIIKKSEYCFKVFSAYGDSDAAIKKAIAYETDIVFVELCIDGDGGLKAAAKMKKLCPNIHIVLISSFDSYEIIRQAFIKGVDDCILENASFDIMDKSLAAICKKVVTQKENDEFFRLKEKRDESAYQLARESFFYEVIFRGRSDDSGLPFFREVFDIGARGCIIDIEFDKSQFVGSIDAIKTRDTIKDVINGEEKIIKGPVLSDRIMLLYDVGQTRKLDEDKITCLSEKIINAIYDNLGIEAYVGVGDIHKLENIHMSYEEAIKAIRFKKDKNIIFYNKISSVEKTMSLESVNQDVKKIEEYIKLGSSEAIAIFSGVLNKLHALDVEARKNKIIEILFYLIHYVSDLGHSECDYVDAIGYVKNFDYIPKDEIDIWSINKMQYILKAMNESGREKLSKPIQYAKQYIVDHYNEPISLSEVADNIGVSSQYLSKIFKDETGYNYIEWVNLMRVERAKQLIEQSELSMSEIAFEVGYSEQNYFSRSFKKYTGISPSKYAKDVKKE